ncbi:Sugar transport protein mst8 [Thalictrum thalictroides]|uniref:Sugar transport protein mst8 n=1 Tax=Thalictrum thalictroides TaxID=46969 RepID=A0A7J6WK89_THATH|nr:Sugar transport protein mst8 [Thalictrum thalictroides]
MLATIASFYLVDRAGRRILLLGGGVEIALFQFVVEGLVWNKFGVDGTAISGQSYAILVLLCICQIVIGFAVSWGPLGWRVPIEIFPLEVRPALQRTNVCVNMFFAFIIAQIFLKMLELLKFGLFFFFGGFGIIMNIFLYFFLPETKGIPIEEMSRVWKNHWYWKRFTDDDYELEEKKVQ